MWLILNAFFGVIFELREAKTTEEKKLKRDPNRMKKKKQKKKWKSTFHACEIDSVCMFVWVYSI